MSASVHPHYIMKSHHQNSTVPLFSVRFCPLLLVPIKAMTVVAMVDKENDLTAWSEAKFWCFDVPNPNWARIKTAFLCRPGQYLVFFYINAFFARNVLWYYIVYCMSFPLFVDRYTNLCICIFVDNFLSRLFISVSLSLDRYINLRSWNFIIIFWILLTLCILRCDRNKEVRAEMNKKEGGTQRGNRLPKGY